LMNVHAGQLYSRAAADHHNARRSDEERDQHEPVAAGGLQLGGSSSGRGLYLAGR
jgi:hypothetical protein